MDVISISVILIVSAILLVSVSFIFIKIYGRGILCGLKLTAAVVIDCHDDAEAVLCKITDNLCSECECSSLKIIIIDGGMSIEQYGICQKYCEKYSFFVISSLEKLSEQIITIQNNI